MADSDTSNLPPEFRAMMRLMEDDVTPANAEQHIADYQAFLKTILGPAERLYLGNAHREFLETVRAYAAYQLEERGYAPTTPD